VPRGPLALAIALIIVCAPAPAQAVAPGANGRIAFDSDHDGASDIYTVRPDGSGVRRLTTSDDFEDNPSWSPRGRRIAYIRNQQVWVMKADGSGQHQITRMRAALRDPAWSPGGRRIMFATDDRGEDIWTVRPDGRKLRRVTDTPRAAEFQPSWAPDGKRIAFVRERSESYKVAVASQNGTGEQVLMPRFGFTQLGPTWSPGGTRIAFYDTDGTVYFVNSDGSDRRRAEVGSTPAFSPDGRRLAVSDQDVEGERGAIVARNLRGGPDVRLSPFPARDLCDNPDWQRR
jgi:TolB protein